MSSFANEREAGEGFENKLYTGVENFAVVAVCPTHDELKKIYGDRAKEPNYLSKNDNGNPQVRIDIMLDNKAEEGEPSIKTRVSYFVSKEERPTKDGNKKQYINLYGQTAWLTADDKPAASGDYELQGAKGTYVFRGAGARPAYNGEEQLIGFIRTLMNLESVDKAEDPKSAQSQFSVSDWNTMFNGDMSAIRQVLKSNNKIGLLLGVKTSPDGKMYQDVYNRNTLRQWAKAGNRFDYLRDDVDSAKQNGAYPNTDFGNPDYILREFTQASPTNESAIPRKKETADVFNADTADAFTGDTEPEF